MRYRDRDDHDDFLEVVEEWRNSTSEICHITDLSPREAKVYIAVSCLLVGDRRLWDGITAKRVADMTGIDPADVRKAMNKLSARGLKAFRWEPERGKGAVSKVSVGEAKQGPRGPVMDDSKEGGSESKQGGSESKQGPRGPLPPSHLSTKKNNEAVTSVAEVLGALLDHEPKPRELRQLAALEGPMMILSSDQLQDMMEELRDKASRGEIKSVRYIERAVELADGVSPRELAKAVEAVNGYMSSAADDKHNMRAVVAFLAMNGYSPTALRKAYVKVNGYPEPARKSKDPTVPVKDDHDRVVPIKAKTKAEALAKMAGRVS